MSPRFDNLCVIAYAASSCVMAHYMKNNKNIIMLYNRDYISLFVSFLIIK